MIHASSGGDHGLATQAELGDQGFIPALVLPLQIVQQAAAAADQHQQAAAAVTALRSYLQELTFNQAFSSSQVRVQQLASLPAGCWSCLPLSLHVDIS